MTAILKYVSVAVFVVFLIGCAGPEQKKEPTQRELPPYAKTMMAEIQELRTAVRNLETNVVTKDVLETAVEQLAHRFVETLKAKADGTAVAALHEEVDGYRKRIEELEAHRKEVDGLLRVRQAHFRGLKNEVNMLLEHLNFGKDKNQGVVGDEIYPFPLGKADLEALFKSRPEIKAKLDDVKKQIAAGRTEVHSVVAFEDITMCKPSAPAECKTVARDRGLAVAKYLGLPPVVAVRPPTDKWGERADNRRVIVFRFVKGV